MSVRGLVGSTPLWQPLLLAGVAGLLVLFALGLGRDTSFIPSPLIGRTAPAFELRALEDEAPIRLADYRGRAVVVNFWASWCGGCATEHDLLVRVGGARAGRPDVAFLGVNYRDGKTAARRFLEKRGAFPYASGVDPRGRTGIDFGVYGLPETFFLGPDGTVVAKHVGPLDAARLKANLKRIGVE